jgi:hypothetical protein
MNADKKIIVEVQVVCNSINGVPLTRNMVTESNGWKVINNELERMDVVVV